MSVLQKFEKFALTKEQGNVLKGGGEWTCHYFQAGTNKAVTSTSFLNAETAISNCSGDVGRDGVYCGGCEPKA